MVQYNLIAAKSEDARLQQLPESLREGSARLAKSRLVGNPSLTDYGRVSRRTSRNRVIAHTAKDLSDKAGSHTHPVQISKFILRRSAAKRGSLRSGSRNGKLLIGTMIGSRSSIARSIQVNAWSISPRPR